MTESPTQTRADQILKHLTTAYHGSGIRVTLPFIYYKKPHPTVKDGFVLGTIFMQYDAPGVTGHKRVTVQNYCEAPLENGIYLVKAFKESDDDVRVEAPFWNGVIWGWFAKEMASTIE